jgi:hypothetical protein
VRGLIRFADEGARWPMPAAWPRLAICDQSSTLEQAADVMSAYISPELYELLVIGRGWPAEHSGTFVE